MYRAPLSQLSFHSPTLVHLQSIRQLLIIAVLLTTLLGGCAQLGPQVLSSGRPQYNVAVQETESQQILLNIVRQRYRDPVLFLDVTSISSGFSLQASAGLSGSTDSSALG